jgi:hypothetical protein
MGDLLGRLGTVNPSPLVGVDRDRSSFSRIVVTDVKPIHTNKLDYVRHIVVLRMSDCV